MLPSPAGSITAIMGRETEHFVESWRDFDSGTGERRSRFCIVHITDELVPNEAARNVAKAAFKAGKLPPGGVEADADPCQSGTNERKHGKDNDFESSRGSTSGWLTQGGCIRFFVAFCKSF